MLASSLTLSIAKFLPSWPKNDLVVKLVARACPRFLQTTVASSIPQRSSQTGRPPTRTLPESSSPVVRQIFPGDKHGPGTAEVP